MKERGVGLEELELNGCCALEQDQQKKREHHLFPLLQGGLGLRKWPSSFIRVSNSSGRLSAYQQLQQKSLILRPRSTPFIQQNLNMHQHNCTIQTHNKHSIQARKGAHTWLFCHCRGEPSFVWAKHRRCDWECKGRKKQRGRREHETLSSQAPCPPS